MAHRRRSSEPAYQTLAGIHPETGRHATFKIEVAFLEKLKKFGPAAKLGSLMSVASTIADPTRCLKGLRRQNQDDGYAIMSRPSDRYFGVGPEDRGRSTDGTAFFVYCSGELVIHDWDWVDFLKDVGPDVPKKPNGSTDTKAAENQYCSQTFQVELSPPKPL